MQHDLCLTLFRRGLCPFFFFFVMSHCPLLSRTWYLLGVALLLSLFYFFSHTVLDMRTTSCQCIFIFASLWSVRAGVSELSR